MSGAFAEYDKQHREQGRWDDGGGSQGRARLIAHHLLFTALHVENACVCIGIQECNKEHEIIHAAQRLCLFPEDQKNHKEDRDGQIREGLDTRNVFIELFLHIILGTFDASPQAERHDRCEDQKPGLENFVLIVLLL